MLGTTDTSNLVRYLERFPEEMGLTEDDPDAVLDRYCTRDFEHWNDGIRLDRERLIAHARPARRNAVDVRVEVHDAFVAGDRVAARYALRASLRNGRVVATEICMIGHLAPDGRLRRIDSITRTL
ncbi:nuclear transport factor 2 family protein [Pseudonocardia aurantiaca]|uniref:Nuclear transport factor 2 family protein n=1 Tax=Pseudonocardia aurantiaca TaxID=75290 RepID=A0ABW4FLU5_9PSEU